VFADEFYKVSKCCFHFAIARWCVHTFMVKWQLDHECMQFLCTFIIFIQDQKKNKNEKNWLRLARVTVKQTSTFLWPTV